MTKMSVIVQNNVLGAADEMLGRVIRRNISAMLRDQVEKFVQLEARFRVEVGRHQDGKLFGLSATRLFWRRTYVRDAAPPNSAVKRLLAEIGDELFKNSKALSDQLGQIDLSPAFKVFEVAEPPFKKFEFFRFVSVEFTVSAECASSEYAAVIQMGGRLCLRGLPGGGGSVLRSRSILRLLRQSARGETRQWRPLPSHHRLQALLLVCVSPSLSVCQSSTLALRSVCDAI